jgi:hypothetical protein
MGHYVIGCDRARVDRGEEKLTERLRFLTIWPGHHGAFDSLDALNSAAWTMREIWHAYSS